jgi:hypothetical protein
MYILAKMRRWLDLSALALKDLDQRIHQERTARVATAVATVNHSERDSTNSEVARAGAPKARRCHSDLGGHRRPPIGGREMGRACPNRHQQGRELKPRMDRHVKARRRRELERLRDSPGGPQLLLAIYESTVRVKSSTMRPGSFVDEMINEILRARSVIDHN